MDVETVYRELLALNADERIGKRYLAEFEREIMYTEIYLLRSHPEEDPIELLKTDEAQLAQKRIYQLFYDKFHDTGMSEEQFMVSDRGIMIEKLLRYVYIPSHKHDFVELTYILCGACEHIIGDQHRMQHPGDFTIIPPGVRHELHADSDCVCLTIKIRGKIFHERFTKFMHENSFLSTYLSQVNSEFQLQCALTMHSGEDRFIRDMMLNIWAQQEQSLIYSEFIIESLLEVLFAYLMQNYNETTELTINDTDQNIQVAVILQYVYENYQTITLAETARHFYLNASYLSTRIRKLTGRTFTDLLRSYKLKRAAELLSQTELNLDAICETIGYQNTAQFIRSFKSFYHCTPGQNRKSTRPKKNKSQE